MALYHRNAVYFIRLNTQVGVIPKPETTVSLTSLLLALGTARQRGTGYLVYILDRGVHSVNSLQYNVAVNKLVLRGNIKVRRVRNRTFSRFPHILTQYGASRTFFFTISVITPTLSKNVVEFKQLGRV